MSTYQPTRVVADLRELANRTGGPEGSRRLAWTPDWLQARAFFRESLATLPVEIEEDEAGNLWAILRGERPDTVLVGSHLDSVPKGGWLDGALGVMAGVELLRAIAAEGKNEPGIFARERSGKVCGPLPGPLVAGIRRALE